MAAKSKTVMVVEDERDTADALAYLLELEGYKAIRAVGGRQALELMERERPDLVLLDIMMPDLSGWDVLHMMRDNLALKAVPVILISASPIPEQRQANKTWQEFVAKPFDLEALFRTIDRLLKNMAQQVA